MPYYSHLLRNILMFFGWIEDKVLGDVTCTLVGLWIGHWSVLHAIMASLPFMLYTLESFLHWGFQAKSFVFYNSHTL